MKILIFNWRDIKNTESGGAEVFIHEIAKRWAKKHDVVLFASNSNGSNVKEVIDGVKIIRMGGRYSVYSKAKKCYNRHFSKENFDVIIDVINTRPFFTPNFVKNGEKIIAIIFQLAREFWFYETMFPFNVLGYHFLEDRWLKKYRNTPTVTISDSTKKDLNDLGFKKVFLANCGLNTKPIDEVEKAGKPIIIFLGRMGRAKKPQDVMKAFKIVKEDVKDAELWMVGDGFLKKRLESRNMKDVKFFGHVNNKARDELVKKAWVIAVPGVREGWGMVVTDANALGTPAVGYNIHGLRDSIKNGYNGLSVDNNPEEMAKGIITILKDSELRERLSKNSVDWARQFNWDETAKKILKVMKDVI
ncbi:MAG: glycosyltransferase family 4 protein [Candidatus Aenigmarchaeota archaeon]|nr:glycosyltransferase family 4 protein [Candidatus Aenigmarchaeota archaeon]